MSGRRRHRNTNLAAIAGLGLLAGMPKTPEESEKFQAVCKAISDDAKRRIRIAEERNRELTVIYGVALILSAGFMAWAVMESQGCFG